MHGEQNYVDLFTVVRGPYFVWNSKQVKIKATCLLFLCILLLQKVNQKPSQSIMQSLNYSVYFYNNLAQKWSNKDQFDTRSAQI
jgi:hypothetical protein